PLAAGPSPFVLAARYWTDGGQMARTVVMASSRPNPNTVQLVAGEQAQGLGDGAGLGWTSVVRPSAVEGRQFAFDDAGIGAVSAGRVGECGDLGEEGIE